jgi:hypothetical protein
MVGLSIPCGAIAAGKGTGILLGGFNFYGYPNATWCAE